MVCIQPIWAQQTTNNNFGFTKKGTPIIKGSIKIKFKGNWKLKKFPIKCNKCLGCRLDHASETAVRCFMESQNHKQNCFVTLTYNQKNLPIGNKGFPTLSKEDVQSFLKRLRYYYPKNNIRYIVSGEYGPKTLRPHYHLALFGYKPNDLKKHSQNKQGDWRYTSKELENIWGKGIVIIGELTQKSGSYIARYVTKKVLQPDFEIPGTTKEYIIFSKRPAVGLLNWIENKQKYLKNNGIYIKINEKPRLFPIPNLFIKKEKEELLDYYDFDKNTRKRIEYLIDELFNKNNKNETLEKEYDYHINKLKFYGEQMLKERYFMQKLKNIEQAKKNIEEILKKTDLTYEKYLEIIKNKLETNNKRLKRNQI